MNVNINEIIQYNNFININKSREVIIIHKNRGPDGKLNICGNKIYTLRTKLVPKTSQRALADMLQLNGLDIDKYAIQKIESGQRFVTDIELKVFAELFHVSTDELIDNK